MIDTHSHIYLPEFDDDRSQVVHRALEAGVQKILMPNIDEESIQPMLDLESEFQDICSPMMGLHPTSVNDDYKKQLQVVEKWLERRSFIGIGEIGIDLYWDKSYRTQQMDAFGIQLNWAKELHIPVVIHCRDAFPEVFEVLERHVDNDLRGVFHSFSAGCDEVDRIMDYKTFSLGINGIVTFKNSNLREVIRNVAPEFILTETDAPYLSPVPYRGKRNEPSYIPYICDHLAEVYGMGKDKFAQLTNENANRLFF
ncbi:TatD family deoxyribonuclease [Marinilabiliaceae bacterium JC017]|nr:TatD family deoxyribonuclease [Marinilabiliaceae bacterium JC017]